MQLNIRSFITISCLMYCSQALAADTQIDEKAVMVAVDATVKEYRVYATCYSLDAKGLSLVNDMWNKSRTEALDDLKSHKASLLFLARFAMASDFSKVLDTSITLDSAIAYCNKNEGQLKQFILLNIKELAPEVHKVLQKK